MSAYAMPGPLFPPIGGSSFGTTSNSSCLGSSYNSNTNNNSYVESPSSSNSQVVGIVVKDARLDPVALTQALTRTPSPKDRRRIRGTPSTAIGSVPPLPIPVVATVTTKSTTTRIPNGSAPPTKSTVQQPMKDKHEEAIQFDLSIRFNGQKYSATRTLTSILQLRRDLIRELRRTRSISRSTTTTLCEIRDMIPEVPSYCGDDCPTSMTRGFTMIQALLRNYCPVLEGWLQCVVDVVGPTSQTLEDFLWEPKSTTHIVFDPLVGGGGGTTTNTSNNSSTKASTATNPAPPTTLRQCSSPSLQSIKEGDDDDTLEEEEEER